MNSSQIIRVTGKGLLRFTPDTTRLTITLQGREHEYSDAVKKSTEDTESLKSTLEKLGFEKKDIKTLSFDVQPRYESYRDRMNNYKEKFVGYEFTHDLKIEFANNNDLLGKTLYALSHSAVHPSFRISYTVADPEARKNELLRKAIADAREKAAVLTTAAGVSLNEIISIDYSWGQISLEIEPMRKIETLPDAAGMGESYMMDIEPDDIEASDTVTIVWSISG